MADLRIVVKDPRMELGIHLPLIEWADEGQSAARINATVDAARDGGFATLAANDHFFFQRPWLDGLTALASVVERSGTMRLATTISLVSLRGPVALAKTLSALDLLSGGRVIAGVGPGSSQRDYEAAGLDFEARWKRFDDSVVQLRALLRGESGLAPAPVQRGGPPIWIGSWGSDAGLRRVARLADGWLASAYNTNPDRFAAARERLPEGFPNALGTMWTWVTEDEAERERVLADILAPVLRRPVEDLRDQVCVGSAEQCASLLSGYAAAGCQTVLLWPLGDEARQIELVAADVMPRLA